MGRRTARAAPLKADHEIVRERLADIEIRPCVGRVGHAYDNRLAEAAIGLFKTEVIGRRGSWSRPKAVACATLDWIDRLDHQRLFGRIGDIPPAEAKAHFYAKLAESADAALLEPSSLRRNRGDSQSGITLNRRRS